MTERIIEKGGHVVLCVPTVIEEKTDGTNPMDNALDKYAAIVKRVARKNRVEFYNTRKVFIDALKNANTLNKSKDIFTIDTVHINDKGNELLANTFIQFLN